MKDVLRVQAGMLPEPAVHSRLGRRSHPPADAMPTMSRATRRETGSINFFLVSLILSSSFFLEFLLPSPYASLFTAYLQTSAIRSRNFGQCWQKNAFLNFTLRQTKNNDNLFNTGSYFNICCSIQQLQLCFFLCFPDPSTSCCISFSFFLKIWIYLIFSLFTNFTYSNHALARYY
jgi:hypothetical protein